MKSPALLFFLSLTVVTLARPFGDRLLSALRKMSNEELTAIEEAYDWEEMQADAPAAPISNETDPRHSLDIPSGRDKEQRIRSIKEQVLRMVGRGGSPNITLPVLLDNKQTRLMLSKQEILTDKIHTFYPCCELPHNTDEELWERGHQMNLYFDINFPAPLPGSTLSIQWAKLRLYKLPQVNVTLPVREQLSGNQPAGEIGDKKHYIHFPGGAVASLPLIEEKQYRVSVYWYTRSLKKHRVKRKLLDSQMLSQFGETWTDYNIKSAVKVWKEQGRNFGISVEVEDEDRVILPAYKIFASLNCSQEARSLQTGYADTEDNSTTSRRLSEQLHPKIDLSTRECLEGDSVQYGGVRLAEHHRLRHHPGGAAAPTPAPINDTEVAIPWEDPHEDTPTIAHR